MMKSMAKVKGLVVVVAVSYSDGDYSEKTMGF
jgi:hypothetical protein